MLSSLCFQPLLPSLWENPWCSWEKHSGIILKFFTGNKDDYPFNLRGTGGQRSNCRFVLGKGGTRNCAPRRVEMCRVSHSCGIPVRSRRLQELISPASSLCLARKDTLPPPLLLSPGPLPPVVPAQPLASHAGLVSKARIWCVCDSVLLFTG